MPLLSTLVIGKQRPKSEVPEAEAEAEEEATEAEAGNEVEVGPLLGAVLVEGLLAYLRDLRFVHALQHRNVEQQKRRP